MTFKSLRYKIITWHLLLLLLMMLFTYVFIIQRWFLTALLIFLTGAVVMRQLFRAMRQTNIKLTAFLSMVRSEDFSTRFSEREDELSFPGLFREMNILNRKMQRLQLDNERNKNLFRSMIENLEAGVFLMDAEENIIISNPVARTFLNIRSDVDRKQWMERTPHFLKNLPELRKQNKLGIEIILRGEKQKWLLQRRQLQVENKWYELFLMANLQAEMENKEAEVSEKLMHILTHEIMNSISPVSSLIDTMQVQLERVNSTESAVVMANNDFADLKTAAEIIQRRSYGLMDFVKRYALMARLPRLNMEAVEGKDLLSELRVLVESELKRKDIKLIVHTDSLFIKFRADKQLLLQVLINLVKNAAEALEGKEGGVIEADILKGDGYTYISVKDNGQGVPENIREDIFLPFFSTRDKGSGIGLSLSRKIINAHNGRLSYRSRQQGSVFRIELPD